MDLPQLRYVVAVAETRSFTRAAERCFVVQSALSRRIAGLEREIGVPLFARTSRRVELTPAGKAFLPGARACLAAAERAAADAAAAAGIVRGTLAIGTIPTPGALDLPAVLQRFRAAHPEVHVSLTVGASDGLADAVAAGRLDLALLGLPEDASPRGVATRELARESLVAVVAAGHALAGSGTVPLPRLAEETFADFPSGTPGRAQSDQAFEARGLLRDVPFEVAAPDLMLALVERGLAVALLPASCVAAGPRLATLEVTDGPRRVEHLAWSEFNPSPATRAFLALVDEADATPAG